jgi:hypothetical protein
MMVNDQRLVLGIRSRRFYKNWLILPFRSLRKQDCFICDSIINQMNTVGSGTEHKVHSRAAIADAGTQQRPLSS